MKTNLRRCASFLFALIAAGNAFADEGGTLVIRLPADVPLLGFETQAGAAEIKVGATALQHRVALPPLAALRVESGACIVRVPFTGATPAFHLVAVTNADVSIALAGPTVASAPATATPPAVAAVLRPATALPSTTAPRPATFSPPAVAAPLASPPPVSNPAGNSIATAVEDIFSAGPINFDPVAKADYAIPDSPAAAALGSSSTLLRPATPRQTVTSLLTHFDADGHLQSGFSLAVTPYTLLRARPLTADQYQKSATERFLANLQLSLAAKPDQTLAPSGVRGSAGLSLLFFDAGDLRLDNVLLSQINTTLARPGGFSDADMLGGTTVAPLSTANLALAAQQWEKKKAENWNKASAGLGLAPLFFTRTGQLNDLKGDGLAAWLSWAQPGPGRLAESTQFILGGSAFLNQQTLVAGTSTRTDTVDFGTQLRFGSASFNGFAEAVWRRRTPARGAHTDTVAYEVGLEKRLQPGLWLNLSWSNDDHLTGGETLRTGLRYGFGNKAVLANPQQ